jgi:hypothetical protein
VAAIPDCLIMTSANPLHATQFEPEVLQMVRRLADKLDSAVDPKGDDRTVVSEALIRLALAVYVNTQGAAETRDRLMTLALTLSPPATVH